MGTSCRWCNDLASGPGHACAEHSHPQKPCLCACHAIKSFSCLFLKPGTRSHDHGCGMSCRWCEDFACIDTRWWDCQPRLTEAGAPSCVYTPNNNGTATIQCPEVSTQPAQRPSCGLVGEHTARHDCMRLHAQDRHNPRMCMRKHTDDMARGRASTCASPHASGPGEQVLLQCEDRVCIEAWHCCRARQVSYLRLAMWQPTQAPWSASAPPTVTL